MSNRTAESLAQDVLGGAYTPGEFLDCKPDLPIDRNPHAVRYAQFVLFRNPTFDPRSLKEPEYAVLQQYRLFGRDPDPNTNPIDVKVVKPIARELSRDVLRVPLPGARDDLEPKHLPSPNARIDVDRLRAIAFERQIPGYYSDATGAELRSLYKGWHTELIRDRIMDTVVPLERAGFDFDEEFNLDINYAKLGPVLESIVRKTILPRPFQPFRNPHPHFALYATFEQTWEPRGYTRGELINTISLAPGEQLTLEIHSWDKSTIKSEEELATELELRVSENLTERDVLTVVRNVATKLQVGAEIPIKGAAVTLGGDVNTSLQNALNQTRERTTQASNTLKTTRKLRIEVAREVGREQRQTRIVANTNRCHTLNCHYFEIMSNYLVTTNLESVQLCLLFPLTKEKVTSAWVLCHADILTQALLDKAFLPGIKAGTILETHAAFLALKKDEAKARGGINGPEDELKRHVGAILEAFADLKKSLKRVKRVAKSDTAKGILFLSGTLPWAGYVAAKCGVSVLRQVLYFAMLHANETCLKALSRLSAEESGKSSEALRNFLAVVTPRDFEYNVVSATHAKALDSVGIPSKLVDALVGWGFLSFVDFTADDAGLYESVKAAAARVEELWGLPPAAESGAVKEGLSTMEVAEARVNFEQLKCHIYDNWLHYMQAIWLREHLDERFVRLQGFGTVATILDNELVGFLGHKAAYPINDLEAVRRWIDLDEINRTISIPPGEPQLVTLPTQGTLLEAIVGECDACEDFIQRNRVLDVRMQEANSQKEEAEVRRREMRLDADPPDLSPFAGPGAAKVIVNIDDAGMPPTP